MTMKEMVRSEPRWQEPLVQLPIQSDADYVVVAEGLKTVKAFECHVIEWFRPLKEKAHGAWRGLCDREKETLKPAKAQEANYKAALVTYTEDQERARRAEEQRLREDARRREEQRRLEEAAALERQAVDSGNVALGIEAQTLLDTPVETPVVQVAPTTPKVAGISYRDTYRAQLVNLMALVTHVATHPEHANLLTLNQPAANQLARSLKTNLRVPGLEVVVQKVPAAGSR